MNCSHCSTFEINCKGGGEWAVETPTHARPCSLPGIKLHVYVRSDLMVEIMMAIQTGLMLISIIYTHVTLKRGR